MLQVQSFTFNPIQENTYLVWNNELECILIDPGNYEKEENNALVAFIESKKLKPIYILNTHCHIDHVLGNSFLKNKYKISLHIPKLEVEMLNYAKIIAPHYGLHLFQECDYDFLIDENSELYLGKEKIKIFFVPGHSPGHLAFAFENEKIVFSGDVLFFRSIGRSDLPGGNHKTLINSIEKNLFTLAPEYKVFAGHGKPTTVGDEIKNNPFF